MYIAAQFPSNCYFWHFLDAIGDSISRFGVWKSVSEWSLSQFSICNHCKMLSHLLDFWSCLGGGGGGVFNIPLPKISLKMASKYPQISWLFLFIYDISERHFFAFSPWFWVFRRRSWQTHPTSGQIGAIRTNRIEIWVAPQ